MTSRTRTWLVYGGLLLLLVLLIIGMLVVSVVSRGGARNIRLGADTTYITEPIGGDGMVDYLAALNQMSAADVSPDKNAAADLLRAFGPRVLEERLRTSYYQALGITPLPAEGSYLVTLSDFASARATPGPASVAAAADADVNTAEDVDRVEAAQEQLDRCLGGKWTAEEFPLIDAWTRANQEPLRWIERASRQPAYYMPLLTNDGSSQLITALLPIVSQQRDAVRLLCLRANRAWAQRQTDAALDDCLAALRLSRLTSQAPTLIDSLVAIACQRIASLTLEHIVASGELTASQLRDFIARAEQLAPMRPVWQKLEYGERFSYLSAAHQVARRGIESLNQEVSGPNYPDGPPEPPVFLGSDLIDWNLVLRDGNRRYDQIVSAGRATSYAEHQQAVQVIKGQLNGLMGQYRSAGRLLRSALSMDARSRLMADMLAALMLPALDAAYQAEYRDTMFWRVDLTALWLAVYRQEQGQYPDSLEQLVPDYLSQVPVDVYTGQSLTYRRVGDGFLLYSVGPDKTDNGGAELSSGPNGLIGDLCVRFDDVHGQAAPAEASAPSE